MVLASVELIWSKQAATGKFAAPGLTGTANW
jgi:hypothetical protein